MITNSFIIIFFTINPFLFQFTNSFLYNNNYLNKKYSHVNIVTKLNNPCIRPIILYNTLPVFKSNKNNNINLKINIINILNQKKKGLLQLIRYKNILPTLLLSITGGWIINPNLFTLFTNPLFLITSLNNVLIMSSSMIINDLFDIEIDRINFPTRPLVTGEVTTWEALLYIFFLLITTEFLSLHFLSSNLQFIMNTSILGVLLYTPIFKRIIFIKNIFCASIVSFSIFVSGLSATHTIIELNKNFDVLAITLSLTFLGSLYNELLLDIRDYEGDIYNNIIIHKLIIN